MAKKKKAIGRRGNNEGGISSLKDGRFRVSVSIRLPNGKPHRVYRIARTRADARVILDQLKADKAAGVDLVDCGDTLGPSLDNWLAVVIKPNREVNTHESYRHALDAHIKPQLGAVRKKDLTAKVIEVAFANMSKAGTGARTRQNAFTVLSAALDKLAAWGEIPVNPMSQIEKPKDDPKDIRPLTREQARHLLETAKGHQHEALYRLALTTGMRSAELFGLHRDAIDLKAKTVAVRQEAIEVNGKLIIKKPKTKCSLRMLHITDSTAAAIKKHLATIPATCEIVFPNQDGGYLRKGGFRKWSWMPLLIKAEIEHRGFHHLRHTFATLMLIDGVELQTVSAILGHSKPSVTADIYAHVLPSRKGYARDRASQLFD